MTPKENAFNLYFKFIYDVVADHEKAKQCAIIAVDEILDIVNSIYDYDREVLYPYWQEVKSEINQL